MNSLELQKNFELFREFCIEIRRNYNTYVTLFNDCNKDLLSKVAAMFFSDISEIMQHYWILQVCRIMDPACHTIRKEPVENITINLINAQLEECSLMNNDIKIVTDSIFYYGNKLKPARHKRIAHNNKNYAYTEANNVLGETSAEELLQFISDIQQYCDLVGTAIGIGPLDFSSSSCKGDVVDLLRYLNKI